MNASIDHIYETWHACARDGDVAGLISLYADDAIFESPLVPALMQQPTGLVHGRAELQRFFAEGTRRRPHDLVRWYRTGKHFTDGRTLIWEYPRETPGGEQVDILEVMEIADGKIRHHRIYWGWLGTKLLIRSVVGEAATVTAGGEQSWF